MGDKPGWWEAWRAGSYSPAVEGLVAVAGYVRADRPPEEVYVMEKAAEYGADAVFFEVEQYGRKAAPQAFIFGAETLPDDMSFAALHRKLWSWGGVPLVYRAKPGLLQLFRCAHKPDFLSPQGRLQCSPVRQLLLAAQIDEDPWWDQARLRSGTLWTESTACDLLLSSSKSAHKSLFDAFKRLSKELDQSSILPKRLRRRLLILSLLIAYLEQREVFGADFFAAFMPNAQRFFQVLANGPALVKLLNSLHERFNGNIFHLNEMETERLLSGHQLARFARLIEAREDNDNQLSLWELYSFRDLPVELISQIYQLFVENVDSSVYTPAFLVRFIVEEALSWDSLDRITSQQQVILDPSCGSGVFLVEAYKRLVLHWRLRHGWQRADEVVLKGLLHFVRGIDLEEDAVELAGFSLCLAMCDALRPEEIRQSIKLFPNLRQVTLHHGCFFQAKEDGLLPTNIGAILGNPPFASKLLTPASMRSYEKYQAETGKLPDKQVGYLFLHEASSAMAEGATLSMLQQYNFLYNQNSLGVRKEYFGNYWVREILDFVSVRGLFQKGSADTKVIVVVAQKVPRPQDATLLHATFRRTGRIDAEQGLDLDYYDLHVVPYTTVLASDRLWRANLMGGGRALSLSNRLGGVRTLKEYASEMKWDFGEGFIEGQTVNRKPAEHLTGKPYLPSKALTDEGVDRSQIGIVRPRLFRSAYTAKRYTPPMLLVREQMDLAHALWEEKYLVYTQRVVGFCGSKADLPLLKKLDKWMRTEKRALKAYLALTSPGLFAQKATALQADDIYSLPYPDDGSLDLSENERVIIDDIVDFQSDLIRLGESSNAMRRADTQALQAFAEILCRQIRTVYGDASFRWSGEYSWSGAVCQVYSFGEALVDWSGADELKDRIASLLRDKTHTHVNLTRVCRLYDRSFIFILKPDRLRYWLRSIALRDADEVLADLRIQGY